MSKQKMDEEKIYSTIAKEIESNKLKKGLWTKAFSESEGDEKKTKALYIKYRFDQIQDSNKKEEEEELEKQELEEQELEEVVKEEVVKEEVEEKPRCFYCKKDNANFYDYLPFRDRSEYFCNKTCFNKKLGGRVFGHETWFEKIIDGDFGLAKAYWLFYFIPNGLLTFLIQKVPNEQYFWIYGFYSIYLLPVMLGIWRAADRYEGSKIWSFLAKFTIILGLISLIIVNIIYFNLLPK